MTKLDFFLYQTRRPYRCPRLYDIFSIIENIHKCSAHIRLAVLRNRSYYQCYNVMKIVKNELLDSKPAEILKMLEILPKVQNLNELEIVTEIVIFF